jgi:hypothetical protein
MAMNLLTNRPFVIEGAGIYGPLTAIELPSNKIYQQD